MDIQFQVPCLLGLEAPIAEELRFIEARDVCAENGRVLFKGDEKILARANICCRFAERIQIVTGQFEAHTFTELFDNVKAIPWEMWIGKNDKFPVKGYSLSSDLFSISDCQSIIKKAVVERLKLKYKIPWFEETGSLYQIQFSIMKNKVTMLIDTSGVALHKRGYRPAANAAPIKETLAAALCNFSRLRHYHTQFDPMCGSGTLLIEGALYANNIAPGIHRTFTAEGWRQISSGIWFDERERARSLQKVNTDYHAFGSDIDTRALDIARQNASRAGVGDMITFEKADIRNFNPASEKGTLIVNPPYGERLLDLESARELYRIMGEVFVQKHGWSYSIITADDDFEKIFGREADKRRKLYNGMIRCNLYMYFK